ncbi:MAG: HK97 gp10 family phage protein [Phycisphaerales bacterium]|jgi:HK97 gp10 family phage protein
MTRLRVEVQGLEGLRRKFDQLQIDKALRAAMHKATRLLERDVTQRTPVDTGRLRSSIGSEVKGLGSNIVGSVGSNVVYAPYVEHGTRPHWPPIAAMETWARRHGMTAFVAARAIARFGTRARRMFQGALEAKGREVQQIFDDAIAELVGRL